MLNADYVVVGAGISGLTAARYIAETLNRKVLVVEKRRHIGGNCYDYYDKNGILIHKYGPHIFHTDDKEVFDFLSRFTAWSIYQHRVLTYVDGNFLPLPICVKTINGLFNLNLSTAEVQNFLDNVRDKQREVKNSEDVVLKGAGEEIYQKFFKNYTKKQWDAYPSELSADVISRVPIRCNSDERYFTDQYQAMPRDGYSAMFANMADHPNISLLLGVDYRDLDLENGKLRKLIVTSRIDEFFHFTAGKLQYRSLDIEFQTHDVESYQPAAVVNYPNDYDFTRITEYKKLTGQSHGKTVISLEYPTWEGEPYYPVPNAEQAELYQNYATLAKTRPDVLFLGRLAEYKYYNMDKAVKSALQACAEAL